MTSSSRLTNEIITLKEALLKAEEKGDLSAKTDIFTAISSLSARNNHYIPLVVLKETGIVKVLQTIAKTKTRNGNGDVSDDNNISIASKALIKSWKNKCQSEEIPTPATGSADRKSGRQKQPVNYTKEVVHESSELKDVKKKITRTGSIKVKDKREKIPPKNAAGELVFPDYPDFRPNMTPQEVLQAGSFGGTYYRSIYSSVTETTYDSEQWKEFPAEWFKGLNIKKFVNAKSYDTSVNRYKIDCGGDLNMWESSGWITEIDPYGWFQWYCRFYLGRRCSDDERQIKRGLGVIGKKGRWRNNLKNKILNSAKNPKDALQDNSISPKVRQLLQHWGYTMTLKDLQSSK